ncbi:MAG: sigma-54-dependent Fis family transcriptional regulator [Polyangiaceae bacterium]|nr:sigma-54-dependent Fis family transcriptional regulator [Polyangiaceae bacterium]
MPSDTREPSGGLGQRYQRRPGPWTIEVGSVHGVCSRVLLVGESLVVGSGHNAGLRVADPAVGDQHCLLKVRPGGLTVEDLGSGGGVFLGPARVAQATLVSVGASFVIGATTVTIRPGVEEEPSRTAALPGMVGGSTAMRRVAYEVRRHAATRAPILLQGESGTGKDLVAQALHTLSRRPGAYVPLNAGAMPEPLADAELFGHRRGAFTGAVANRSGAFELAHQGTLFLDEIAEIPASVQVRLLRVVEDGQVRALGASKPIRVDTRIVSASWAPLADRVADGSFRADLYHRLSTAVVRLPPLRQRRSDIPELCEVLLRRMDSDVGVKRLAPGALARLVTHSWPGNVRELNGVLYRAALLTDQAMLEPQHIELAFPPDGKGRKLTRADAPRLLELHRGNVSAAARACGVARSTFRSWLEKPHSQE